MRVLVESYGTDARIFYDRPFGYKRYHVEWSDGTVQMFHGVWYSEQDVRKMVETRLFFAKGDDYSVV
jgi:hypothetical protein